MSNKEFYTNTVNHYTALIETIANAISDARKAGELSEVAKMETKLHRYQFKRQKYENKVKWEM